MRIILLLFILFSTLHLGAQTAVEALRYSTYNIESTARNTAVGGAMSGLGADFVSLSTNPAGLGGFRFSEWSFTPAIFHIGAKSDFENASIPNTEKESKAQFLFSEIGFVKVRKPQEGVWYTSNFAIGYNQLQNFNQEFLFSGNSRGSIVDRFIDQAREEGFDDFESGLAFDSGAIYRDANSRLVSDMELNPNAQIAKEQLVTRTGSQGELSLGLGGNYKERMLVGISVGIPIISYTETKSYTERDDQSQVPFFENLVFTENLRTSGVGINAKLGVLLMPNRQLRIGGAIHTPTHYAMTDYFDTAFTYSYTPPNGTGLTSSANRSPDGTFNYSFRSPWRYIANAGYILGSSGFLTTEIEYLNAGRAKFQPAAIDDNLDNEIFLNSITADVRESFRSVLNFRAGTEFAWNNLRLRGGIGLGTSPYVGENKINAKFGTGIGLRKNRFFLDLGYRIARFQESYTPFLIGGDFEPNILNAFLDQRFVLTLGFKSD